MIASRFIPVFADMQGLVVENDREFLQALAESVAESIRTRGPAGHSSSPGKVESYGGFTAFMDEAAAGIEGRQIIVLIDEYELIGFT